MTDHPRWYPPGLICYPPELPKYLKTAYDLQPIVGVPNNDEVIRIHSVIHAANRVSVVPGMTNPDLLVKLADHLFSVQMARYRSKYSLMMFQIDATYTPPALPAHVSVTLQPVSGAPSDEEIAKVQDAVRAYQHFTSVPSMFDPVLNVKLSQHLFDIQMARYMRAASEHPNPIPQEAPPLECSSRITEQKSTAPEEGSNTKNNEITGATMSGVQKAPQMVTEVDVRKLIERSNQLAERFNQLLERSNELVGRCTQPADHSNSQTHTEHFNQVLERLTGLVESVYKPAESQKLAEHSNQLLDRFSNLLEQSKQPAQRANELSERANQISERANRLAEEAQKPVERLGDALRSINKVLVSIQHAIIRNHKGNTTSAVDCLVNEKGETPGACSTTSWSDFRFFARYSFSSSNRLPVMIDGAGQNLYIPNSHLGKFLNFYGIDQSMYDGETHILRQGTESAARTRLGDYLSSCLG